MMIRLTKVKDGTSCDMLVNVRNVECIWPDSTGRGSWIAFTSGHASPVAEDFHTVKTLCMLAQLTVVPDETPPWPLPRRPPSPTTEGTPHA